MSRRWVRELKKKWVDRLRLWLLGLAFLTLLDEYVKEGYFFDPRDVINSRITHEKIVIGLILIFMILETTRRRKRLLS